MAWWISHEPESNYERFAMSEDDLKGKKASEQDSPFMAVGGLFDGVSQILGKFGELAEKAELFRQAQSEQPEKKIAGSYGFSVKFGGAGDTRSDVKPIKKSPRTKTESNAYVAPEIREPHVELFEEADHLLLIVEMPGVSCDDVELTFAKNMLHLKGKSRSGTFAATVELPREFGPDQVNISANNGVIEIRLTH
jgi:HSP20 family protein